MPATALEQMLLELINRARLDPAAEAARFGIDLNEGLAPNTISGVSKQPLAMNETLLSVARAHSQDMIDRDYFASRHARGRDAVPAHRQCRLQRDRLGREHRVPFDQRRRHHGDDARCCIRISSSMQGSPAAATG